MIELHVLRQGRSVAQMVLEGAIHCGREAHNDLVLASESVSRHHATLWVQDGQVWMRDHGSRNGTWLNGQRIDEAVPVGDEDTLRLGLDVELRIRGASMREDRAAPWHLEVDGVLFPLRPGTNRVGSASACEVCVVDLPEQLGTITVANDVQMTAEGHTQLLVPNRPVSLGLTRQAVLRHSNHGLAPTAGMSGETWPYRLRIDPDAAAGLECELHDPTNGNRWVATGNSASLLYVLGKQLSLDRRQRKPSASTGWVSDDDVVLGVWGRAGARMDANGLHVLVYRVRRAMDKAGLDPTCLEKKRGAIRLRVASVRL